MSKITERENFFRMVNKERPDFVPHQPSLLQMTLPSALGDHALDMEQDMTGLAYIGQKIQVCYQWYATSNRPVILDDIS